MKLNVNVLIRLIIDTIMLYMTILSCINIQTLHFNVILRKLNFSHLCLRATENVTGASKGLTY